MRMWVEKGAGWEKQHVPLNNAEFKQVFNPKYTSNSKTTRKSSNEGGKGELKEGSAERTDEGNARHKVLMEKERRKRVEQERQEKQL